MTIPDLRRGLRIGMCALALVLPLSQLAGAAKDSTMLTKVYGEGPTAKTSPDGAWVASWVRQSSGAYDLYVIDGKGAKQTVETTSFPGGLAWIPGGDKLCYCKATQGGPTKLNHVTYYSFDPKTKAKNRLLQTDDALETYQLDPIAADDGSRVFALTMDPSLHLPSFNVYFTGPDRMRGVTAPANIGAIYDLSADGSTLYWWLQNPKNHCLNIVSWDLNTVKLLNSVEFPRTIDPAEDWALFKIDAPNKQAALSAFSSSDPTLQLCVYNFANPKNLYSKGIHMGAGENITYFDWKGFSGVLYAVVNYTASKDYGIEEIDAASGQRTQIYRGKEQIQYIDYSPSKLAYYFSVLDNPGSPKVQTRFVRVQAPK